MHLLDLTLATPEENLALDDALLEMAEETDPPHETLRFWESPEPVVVVGRSSQVALEVNLPFCRERGIPVLRRSSGGAAIVAARGCLMYAVTLSYDLRPALRSLEQAHRFTLETVLEALRPVVPGAMRQVTSDLTLEGCKFSGNSMRCKRRNFLYHGTLLYDFPLPLVEQCLTMPPRQPAYRKGRDHRAFVINLPASSSALRAALIEAWNARELGTDWPRQRVQDLIATRYGRTDWNYQL
ncbi:MAG TPA: lipoate--protein ligase family protein [Pirellulales bacterium]|nr:lipoate--protein ligase family protein [Pirellulales bacterium]